MGSSRPTPSSQPVTVYRDQAYVNKNNTPVTFKTAGELDQYEKQIAAANKRAANRTGNPVGGKKPKREPNPNAPEKKEEKCRFFAQGSCKKGEPWPLI